MSIADELRMKLEQTGLPYREIQCYGRQIVVTTKGEASARKWASLLAKFSKVRAVVKSMDRHTSPTRGTSLNPQMITVWRVFAAIETAQA